MGLREQLLGQGATEMKQEGHGGEIVEKQRNIELGKKEGRSH